MYLNNYMSLAMSMAKIAYEKDEVPVGAVVVQDGKVIGKGFNKVISKNSVSAHAEIIAINNASQTILYFGIWSINKFKIAIPKRSSSVVTKYMLPFIGIDPVRL